MSKTYSFTRYPDSTMKQKPKVTSDDGENIHLNIPVGRITQLSDKAIARWKDSDKPSSPSGFPLQLNSQKSLAEIQEEIHEWSTRNFGENIKIKYDISSFLGMVEEVGEISHAILKMSQGIRGRKEDHLEAIRDGVADLLVYTLDFCARNGEVGEKLLNEVWNKVQQRDWKKNNLTGKA